MQFHNYVAYVKEKKDVHQLVVLDISCTGNANAKILSHSLTSEAESAESQLFRARPFDLNKLDETNQKSIKYFKSMIQFKYVFLVGGT